MSPSELLRWLCQPELMKQWMPGVDHVEVVDGFPCAEGCLTAVTLRSNSQYGSLGWRLAGRIDEISPARLARTYSMQSMKAGSVHMVAGKSEYLRTLIYDLAPSGAGTQLGCEVRTIIPGLRPSAARAGGKAERRSLHQSLKLLSRLSLGQRISWTRKFRMMGALSPQAL